MAVINDRERLRAIYKAAKGRSVSKQRDHIDAHGRRFIELSPFLVIASGRLDGRTDASPRGEEPGFVRVLDAHRLAIPDRPGNNRLDTMENILEVPEVGVIFFVPGVDETLRVNGRAEIRDDEGLLAQFVVNGKLPATVIVVQVHEMFLHCAKALIRSHLWDAPMSAHRPIPTMGEMVGDPDGAGTTETQEDMLARYGEVLY